MVENHPTPEPLPIALNNFSVPIGLLAGGSIPDFRSYARAARMGDGLDWTMVTRARLPVEIGLQALGREFPNVDENGVPLISGLQQSFAPPLHRVNTRQRVAERLLMPSARGSLGPMRRLQRRLVGDDDKLPGRLYTEALRPGERYTDHNAPFRRSQTISPDLVHALGIESVGALVAEARQLGIQRFGFSTESARAAQESPSVRLEPWRQWLPQLLAAGLIDSLRVSFVRQDLKPQDDPALRASFDQAREILSGDPREDEEHMGDLPAMLATVRAGMAARPHNTPRLRVILHAQEARLAEVAPENMGSAERIRALGEYVADRLGLI
jgi:hypothetical protein